MVRTAVESWVRQRVPGEWGLHPPEVRVDREEILVVVALACPDEDEEHDATSTAAAACVARVNGFRDETRDERVRLAVEAEHLFERKVSWGASCGGRRFVFTHLAVPVMTRLRMGEREVLDTLLDAGVARSRSEALAWCVRLVQRHQGEWIDQLRDALVRVEEVRASGPDPD